MGKSRTERRFLADDLPTDRLVGTMADVMKDAKQTTEGALPANRARDQILDAAMAVALESGVMAVTLERVAARAKLSKGGLIHHFRNKDELLVGMMERFVGHFETRLEMLMATDRRSRHRRIRALLKTARDLLEGKSAAGMPVPAGHAPRLMMSLLTASANNPALLQSIRKKFEAMRTAMLEDSKPDGELALVLWMAFDGLMLWHHLGVISPDDKLNVRLIRRTQKLLEAADPPPNARRTKQR